MRKETLIEKYRTNSGAKNVTVAKLVEGVQNQINSKTLYQGYFFPREEIIHFILQLPFFLLTSLYFLGAFSLFLENYYPDYIYGGQGITKVYRFLLKRL